METRSGPVHVTLPYISHTMKTPQLNDILRLPLAERIRWAETIWDSIVADEGHAASYELSDGQKSILREEVAAYHADPDGGMSWEEAKERIRKG